jgi:hypothetical protein
MATTLNTECIPKLKGIKDEQKSRAQEMRSAHAASLKVKYAWGSCGKYLEILADIFMNLQHLMDENLKFAVVAEIYVDSF